MAAGEFLAVRVQFIDQVADNFDLAIIHVEFAGQVVGCVRQVFLDGDVPRLVRGIMGFRLRHLTFDAERFLAAVQRLAVKRGVGELLGGGAGVVDDVEGQLAVIGPQPGAAPDDLLEFGHGADRADQDDVLAGRRVDAGGQQVRGGQDDRAAGFHVLEAGAVGRPDVALVGGDPAHVVRVLPHQVGVEAGQGEAHLQRVFLIDAKIMVLAKRSVCLRKSVRWRAMAWVRARSATRRSNSGVVYSLSGISRP